MSIDNMHVYSIFHKLNSENNGYGSVVAVCNGFSIYAFLFNILWIFYKKMWIMGLLVLTMLTFIDWLMHYILHYTYLYYLVFHFWFMFAIGVMGNILLSWHLRINGYNMKAITIGKNELNVIRNFFTTLVNNSNID